MVLDGYQGRGSSGFSGNGVARPFLGLYLGASAPSSGHSWTAMPRAKKTKGVRSLKTRGQSHDWGVIKSRRYVAERNSGRPARRHSTSNFGFNADGKVFLGTPNFPYEVSGYAGIVIYSESELDGGTYKLTERYKLVFEQGRSRLFQITGFNDKTKTFYARSVCSGVASHEAVRKADNLEVVIEKTEKKRLVARSSRGYSVTDLVHENRDSRQRF